MEEIKEIMDTSMEQFANKRVVITGGLGFIGSNLAHALVASRAHVVIVDALLPPYGGNQFNVKDIRQNIDVINGDVRDMDSMSSVLEGADIVFHLAGQVSYLDSIHKPFNDLDFNGRGTLTVLEALRKVSPDARVIFSSSRLVYGRILTLPVREDHPTTPLSLYGLHKLLGEHYMRLYAHSLGMSTVSIRIPNPYGPRQQMKHGKYSIVGWFVRQAMDGKTLTVFGDGSQERDYLYITDLVDAMMMLAIFGEPGDVYNVGAHERVQFGDMVDAVLDAVPTGRKEYVPWPDDYEKNETGDYIADTSKLEALTNWRPRVSLQEGIAKMVAYYGKYRDKYW